MIAGIGIDLCEIARLENMKNRESFISRYFTENERKYAGDGLGSRYQRLAGMFAAKEAFVKALGTGFQQIDLCAVEVLHTGLGQPFYSLSGWAATEVEQRDIRKCHLSISHDGGIATAFAILETELK